MVAFGRMPRLCRALAQCAARGIWLGIIGDRDHPYATMDYFAEAQIARELMKFVANGTSMARKPVMWT
jgi:isoleucyl-tRNA synthetase